MFKKIVASFLAALLTASAFAQVPPAKPLTDAEAKLQKDAVEFLRETSVEVGRLRLAENRISFNSELASLMWFHDEKAGREMYSEVIGDFKQLMAQLDSQLNSPDEDADQSLIGGMFSTYGKSKAERKLMIAVGVRQSIASSLAEHAPDLAYSFFYDSQTIISNPKYRELMSSSDKWFERQLLAEIARSDPAKAVEYAKASLKDGVDTTHIPLLRKLYAKDPDKAADLGAAILSKLKTEKGKNAFMINQLLELGDELLESSKRSSKKPLYSQSDLRELAELYVETLAVQDMDQYGEAMMNIQLIEKYAPGRAAQLRSRQASRRASNSNTTITRKGLTNTSANVSTSYGVSNTNAMAMANSAVPDYENQDKLREAENKAESELFKGLAEFGTKPINKEERAKFVSGATASIAKTRGKDKKIFALSLLAAQVAKAGDNDLAAEIMRDAERMVEPQPKNYQDFLLSWTLASGYAPIEPDRAFAILDNTIARANGTIAAAAKMAEFIDVNDDYITDGEAQVGVFGGTMVKGIMGEIGGATVTLRTLAKADFSKTAALANAFDRPEVRVLARMLVIRAILEKEKPPQSPDLDVDILN